MIDTNRMTASDVGRGVVYTPSAGPREDGVVTSYNERYVFVCYTSGGVAATNPDQLDWLGGTK